MFVELTFIDVFWLVLVVLMAPILVLLVDMLFVF